MMDYFVVDGSSFCNELSEHIVRNNYHSRHIFILTDENVNNFCLPTILPVLENAKYDVIVCEGGEENKTLETCCKLWQRLSDLNCDRHSFVIIVGGGVLCDMGSFVAGTFMRGIDYMLIPTTLLAQIDAAFGGKNGINFHNVKNQIGLFLKPKFVAVNTDFLKTLPERQFNSGLAEAIKYGILGVDGILNETSHKPLAHRGILRIVDDAIRFKISITDEDFTENNKRKILNFGHTIGHAVETYYMPQLLHGEAVAFGMVCAVLLSEKKFSLDKEYAEKLISTIRLHFDKNVIQSSDIEGIIEIMRHDKKNENGEIKFVLLNDIHSPVYDITVSPEDIRNAINDAIKIFANI